MPTLELTAAELLAVRVALAMQHAAAVEAAGGDAARADAMRPALAAALAKVDDARGR